MNEFWNSGGGFFLLLLIFAPIYPRVCRRILPRRPYHSTGRSVPLTRKNLRRIAYGRRLRNTCLFIAAELTLTLLLYGIGRLNIPAALGTFAVLMIYPLWYLYATLYFQRRPLLAALRYDRLETELSGAELRAMTGGWQYVDQNWFICVSSGTSAALRAEWIDFAHPVHIRTKYSGISGTSRYGSVGADYRDTEYILHGRDGAILRARIHVHDDIQKWIRERGGKTEWIKN